jgi:hypothetical protein
MFELPFIGSRDPAFTFFGSIRALLTDYAGIGGFQVSIREKGN